MDVADGLIHIINLDTPTLEKDYGGAKCPKFNLVGPEEVDNLSLAKMIAEVQNKPLHYELVDFHSQRPGHDLRYALDGSYTKSLGWEPKIKFSKRIEQVVDWSLKNKSWLEI
jgi:dTDP-glucose 4,6-dehydratase